MRTATTFRHYASACTLSSAACVFFCSARKCHQCDSSNNEVCGLRLMVRVEVLGTDYLQNKRDAWPVQGNNLIALRMREAIKIIAAARYQQTSQ